MQELDAQRSGEPSKRQGSLLRLTSARRHSGAGLSETTRLDELLSPLVRRAQAGDGAARDELLRACHQTVYRWAMVLTRDADEAEDVAQDVLVALYTRLDRYGGRSRF